MTEVSRRELLQAGAAGLALGALAGAAYAGETAAQLPNVPRLGCCYYPEQWPQAWWKNDAEQMAARGISRVRIAEFAWTLMEPEPGRYDWSWLDQAIDVLASAGLGIVLGTPTATPPQWLVARYPEILPVGADGRVRGFGSRRYYTFSSDVYRRECERIATALAERYGKHPAVVGWQIDNEFGCHDTTLSYSPVDLVAFRTWLRQRYQTVEALNTAWGTSVWSQQVTDFDAVGLPVDTPYFPAPAKLLDYRRFASDQVIAFQKAQIDVIRPRSPSRFITTNFMGNFVDFDHYGVAADLDFASWDNYPLGFAARGDDTRWDRTGNPDFAAWNHDVMHAINPAPFWVMEQEAGPVNWSKYNPIPAQGMVRLWTWEAFAHGAATVSHFRWRQVPFGQEQMHSGLNLPDRSISPGGIEVEKVAQEIRQIGVLPDRGRGDVALLFDYESAWMTAIEPNGQGESHVAHAQAWYGALRRLGLDVDIVRPGAKLEGYRLVVAPSVFVLQPSVLTALKASVGLVVVGPRTGSKTQDFAIPSNLAPGELQSLLPVRVLQVETLRENAGPAISGAGMSGRVGQWREMLESRAPVLARYDDGGAAIVGTKRLWYVGCDGDLAFTRSMLREAALEAGLPLRELPDGIRLKRRGDVTFAFNYTDTPWPIPDTARAWLVGGPVLGSRDLAIWRNA